MAEQCIALEDVAYVAEAWRAHHKERVDDGGVRVRDAIALRPLGRIGDTVEVSGIVSTYRFDRITETVRAGESWRLRASASERVADVVRARDTLRGSIHTRWADGAAATDGFVSRRLVRLPDAVAVSEGWKPTGAPRARVTDVVRARDALRLKRAVRVTDAITASDVMAVRPRAFLSDGVRVLDATRPIRHMHMRMADDFTASDAIAVRGQPRVYLADEVFVSERWRVPRAAVSPSDHTAHRVGQATAWTANTDTWGGSRYTNFEFNSLAVVDGVLMGANDEGLWRLDAADDGGEPILGHVQTDMQDYGAEQVKSSPLVYAGVSTNGAMQLTVDAVIKGTPAHYTYTFEPRQAGDFAPGRCKIGRSVRSRYLQFTVGNHSGGGAVAAGADFTIDQLSVLAEAGSRRI